MSEISYVDPRVLRPNPWNTNHVDPKNMSKLRKSIEDLGFTSAVVVRTLADGTYEILGGQHRTEVAVDLKLKSIPVLNLGEVDDLRAKKIGLIDNSRYGSDDGIELARLIEELRIETPDLSSFLPVQEEDLQAIMRAVEINIDEIGIAPEEDEDEPFDPSAERPERPTKTHDMLSFRVTVRESEAIRTLIEKTIKREGLDDGSDDKTLAGIALAFLLLKGAAECPAAA